ncbi:MAG TPA: BON domain-containing protein [Pyrinomonadaceae bacterium]|nr:BON domain-containing protein [Pyrinomonadaceae bacterium]
MSYDEEEQRRSRVVVETPTARREVVQTQTTRTPEREGFSTGMVAAVAMAAIAATALIFLFLMNRSDDTANTNVSISTQPTPAAQSTIIVQQPATQPTPIIIQQAPPTTMVQPAPVVITQPPAATSPTTTTSAPSAATSVPDDATLQSSIDKEFQNDADISITDVTATMLDGKATLIGTVKSQDLKRRAEKLAYKIKGVRSVDNKIVVEGASLTVP